MLRRLYCYTAADPQKDRARGSFLQRRSIICCALLTIIGLSACVSNTAVLNSDLIAKRFGSYGVDVLRADSRRRVSSLYSSDGNAKTTRTYAVVDFAAILHDDLQQENELIVAGGSIGATLRNAGWQIDKRHIYLGEFEIPESYAEISRLMQIELPETLATHVYLLVVSNDEAAYQYATITEIHHPDHLTARRLQEIYGEIILDDSNRNELQDYIGPPNPAK